MVINKIMFKRDINYKYVCITCVENLKKEKMVGIQLFHTLNSYNIVLIKLLFIINRSLEIEEKLNSNFSTFVLSKLQNEN